MDEIPQDVIINFDQKALNCVIPKHFSHTQVRRMKVLEHD